MTDIPFDWYKRALEVVPYGVACVGLTNEFLWVNKAYSALVGYSQAELIGKTWMAITVDAYVGGDLKSIEDLKRSNGLRDSYSLDKKYKHRDGHHVPIALTVFTFCENGTIVLFIACASENMSTSEYVADMRKQIEAEVTKLRRDVEVIKRERMFRLAVFAFVKKYWPIIAGISGSVAAAIWNVSKHFNMGDKQ